MKKLAVAFDFESRQDFLKATEPFVGLKIVCKIGLRLLPLLEPKDFEKLKKHFEIFIDEKLHDIPTQVEGAVRTWAARGADYLTVHLSGGPKMLEKAQKAAEKSSLKLLGVSVLTSLSENDLQIMNFPKSTVMVKGLIDLGLQKGLAGFVLSGHELSLARGISSDSKILWTVPGLSLEAESPKADDQSRTMLLEGALALGATMPVIGRAIFKSPNPAKTVENILQTLNKA